MMNVREAIETRRSIKKFNGKPVTKEALAKIVEAGTWAPNHGTREPWRLVGAVGESMDRMVDAIKEVAVPKWRDMSEEELQTALAKFMLPGAVLFIVVPEDARQKERLEDFGAASAMIQNMQLAAWEMEIGSCWKTPPFIDHPKFRSSLGIQPGERIISMLQFGYFDEAPKAKPRKDVNEILSYFE